MLAAKREKANYVLQPRGKPIFEKEEGSNSFALKMMTKMGWSKDKGLGLKEDGQKEFISIRYKNNNKGMGFQDKDNQWTEHENQFNSLLQNLTEPDIKLKDSDEDRQVESLEEKSKKSRARVHYKKFTRGKDLSKYSAKDLANIFGKKSLDSSKETPVEEGETKEEGDDSKLFGVETYEAPVSSVDYFKEKMQTKLKGPQENKSEENEKEIKKKSKRKNEEESPAEEENEESEEPQSVCVETEENTDKPKESKSKTKRKKVKTVDKEEIKEPETLNMETKLEVPEDNEQKQKEIKKKSKRSKETPIVDVDIEEPENVKENETGDKPKKEKKKNKRKLEEIIETILIEDEPPKKKSKKSKTENVAEEIIDLCNSPSVEKTKKKKKDKKVEDDVEEVVSIEPEQKESKKKSKKRKSSNEENIVIDDKPEPPAQSQIEEQPGTVSFKEDGRINYTINFYQAEILKNLKITGFPGSNFPNLLGYGLNDKIDLKMVEIPTDKEAITNLWFQALEPKQKKRKGK